MIEVMTEFAELLDTSRMQVLFQQALPTNLTENWQLTGCTIQHPRFKTYLNPSSRNKSVLALIYHLNGINALSNAVENKMIYAKAFLADRSNQVYENVLQKNTGQEQHVFHWPEQGLVGWLFPHDPVLTWLPRLFEPANVLHYINHLLLANSSGTPAVITEINTAIVNYRPEIRCTCRHELTKLTKAKLSIFSKTYANDLGREVFRRMLQLHERSLHEKSAFAIAVALGYEEIYRTLWMEALHGKPVLDLLYQTGGVNSMERIACGLANFHDAKIEELPVIGHESILAEIRKKIAKLVMAFPALQPRFQALIALLEKDKTLPLEEPIGLIHGDFHIEQLLLLTDQRIALFDFDELAYGHPFIDVANFCADLFTHVLGEIRTNQMIDFFFKSYLKFTDRQLNVETFNWHLRIQLLTRAYRAYIQQKPDQVQWIEIFLTAAERGYTSGG